MKKAASYLVFVIAILLMIIAVFIYLAPHFGWRVNAVVSGSMEPQLKTGSLVVSRPVAPESVEIGDIIIFRPVSVGETMITHRVTGIGHNSPVYFETKGDANDLPDPFTVPARNLIGKIWLDVPYIGYFAEFLKTPFGFMFAIVIPGAVILAMYIVCVWRTLAKQKIGDKAVTK
ncbi:MAG: signal peptidase I [Chloroflexota bacterium]